MGKFSFLNDPEQVKRENKRYEQQKLKREANSLAMEAVRLSQSNHIDQAREKFSEVLKIDMNNIITYRHLLLMSMDETNSHDSWGYWNKLAEKDPKNVETWLLKGLVEKKYNKLDSAVENI
ncbi:tetratricopeptide repeat protein [Parapedobacter deserti]|uniref:Tetratricopeptide repeat protein n=1 Tax=Parapedobacter deserti TaxID=1912957 RepID=A0ABV7JL57_9SPHI